jgi:hypothetical protein
MDEHFRRYAKTGTCMSRKWKGRSGLVLAALAVGVLALILLTSVSSPAVAGNGRGSSNSVADFTLTANYKPPSFVDRAHFGSADLGGGPTVVLLRKLIYVT